MEIQIDARKVRPHDVALERGLRAAPVGRLLRERIELGGETRAHLLLHSARISATIPLARRMRSISQET
jgi:hypothetical protein